MPTITCPSCGEADALVGNRSSGAIKITCGACGHTWARDAEPVCPHCGGRDMRPFAEPLTQRARGTAYSIVGEREIFLCVTCDAAEIEKRLPSVDPLAPREDPYK